MCKRLTYSVPRAYFVVQLKSCISCTNADEVQPRQRNKKKYAAFLEVFAMRFATRVMMLSFVVVGLSTLSPFAFGQAVYGSIYGTVVDSTGAAIPDANAAGVAPDASRNYRDLRFNDR